MRVFALGFAAAGITAAAPVVAPTAFEASYGPSPKPFRINLNPQFVTWMRDRVASTRYVASDLGVPDFSEGPSLANATAVGKYWAENYDWQAQQKHINDFFQQYTTTVHIPESDYSDPVPLHFVHHRSDRADAIPLLFIHGWPETFLTTEHIIHNLTNPANDTLPAFHVVVPTIPGYGFSPAPTKTGFGPIEAAHAFNALMQQLGYNGYVIQAGDVGAIILRQQAALFPDNVISVLPNFWVEAPTPGDKQRHRRNETTEQEDAWFDEFHNFATHAVHFYAGNVAPLQMAYALTDSPLGFAMFIYQFMQAFSPNYIWSYDEVITWTIMLLAQGPEGALRFYHEGQNEGFFVDGVAIGEQATVSIPVGITKRPYDVGYLLPIDWIHRGAPNLTMLITHDAGGHFAAYQDPTFLDDIWNFFGNETASGTGVFKG